MGNTAISASSITSNPLCWASPRVTGDGYVGCDVVAYCVDSIGSPLPLVGRYVSIQIVGSSSDSYGNANILTLCEVKVCPLSNCICGDSVYPNTCPPSPPSPSPPPTPPPLPPAPPFPPLQAAGYCPNLAQGKSVAQSSTYLGFAASNAVDGNANPQWGGFSCTSTTATSPGFELSPWWYVDLGSPLTVAQVFIKNRQDCCSGEMLLLFMHMYILS